MVSRSFYPGEVLVVAVVCAILPYFVIRGPVTRIARLLHRTWAERAVRSTDSEQGARDRPAR